MVVCPSLPLSLPICGLLASENRLFVIVLVLFVAGDGLLAMSTVTSVTSCLVIRAIWGLSEAENAGKYQAKTTLCAVTARSWNLNPLYSFKQDGESLLRSAALAKENIVCLSPASSCAMQ